MMFSQLSNGPKTSTYYRQLEPHKFRFLRLLLLFLEQTKEFLEVTIMDPSVQELVKDVNENIDFITSSRNDQAKIWDDMKNVFEKRVNHV